MPTVLSGGGTSSYASLSNGTTGIGGGASSAMVFAASASVCSFKARISAGIAALLASSAAVVTWLAHDVADAERVSCAAGVVMWARLCDYTQFLVSRSPKPSAVFQSMVDTTTYQQHFTWHVHTAM